ncbi:MAG: hypothetical protein HZC55_06965 [Verrucomicrobia bacterium]|jgi:hypothetical protein|nr:hypothetical protein [Verrucomicrobiota bacterium]
MSRVILLSLALVSSASIASANDGGPTAVPDSASGLGLLVVGMAVLGLLLRRKGK